jgi:hypothetical protein
MLFDHQIENQYQIPVFSRRNFIKIAEIFRKKLTGFSRLTLQENVPSNTSSRFIVT